MHNGTQGHLSVHVAGKSTDRKSNVALQSTWHVGVLHACEFAMLRLVQSLCPGGHQSALLTKVQKARTNVIQSVH